MPTEPLTSGDLMAAQQNVKSDPTLNDWIAEHQEQMSNPFGVAAERELDPILEHGVASEDKDAVDPSAEVGEMYRWALQDYRSMVERLRNVKFATLNAREAKRLDDERSRLHDRVKILGRQIGKTEKMVFADILGCERDLSDYGLPEFKLIGKAEVDRSNFLDSINLDPMDEPEPDVSVGIDDRGNEYRSVDNLRPDEVGMVFARIVGSCISLPGENDRRFAPLSMDDRTSKEAVRRAKLFAADNGYRLLRYSTGCHNYSETVYAIVINRDSLNLATDQIKRSRNEYGIREADIPSDALEKDWQEHQSEVDRDLRHYYSQYPLEVGRTLYGQKWRKLNDPGYVATDEMESDEVKKVLKANGYKLKEGKISKVIDKAKERRDAERERSEEGRMSGDFRRR